MSLPPLAQVSDVTARLPSSVSVETTRVAALLTDASAVVRNFTRQQFTTAQTTDKIRPIGYRLRLPQKPVVSVDSLALLLFNSATPYPFPGWWWDGSDEVWLVTGDQLINLAEEAVGFLEWQSPVCLVTYTHGYDMSPDDVVGVVCSMVIRTLTAPGLGGVVSEGVGEYNYRLSDAAAQGSMALTVAEQQILKPYRPRKSATAELRW